MGAPENCVLPRQMSSIEALDAMAEMARIMRMKGHGDYGLGAWDGTVTGKDSGNRFDGEFIAVFSEKSMVAPFGKLHDKESEACASLFAIAISNADRLMNDMHALISIATMLASDVKEVNPEAASAAIAQLERISGMKVSSRPGRMARHG